MSAVCGLKSIHRHPAGVLVTDIFFPLHGAVYFDFRLGNVEGREAKALAGAHARITCKIYHGAITLP